MNYDPVKDMKEVQLFIKTPPGGFDMDLRKTADELIKRDDEAARALPTETKRIFWRAFHEEEKNVGEARKLAGIESGEVAIALIIQCYKQVCIPMTVEEIE